MNYLIFLLGFLVGMVFITLLCAALALGRNPILKVNKFDDYPWDNDGGRGQ